jgi:hypothetical protein
MKIDRLQPLQLITIILICGCMLIGCHNPLRRKDQINRIEIATGGCLHGCPVIGLRIDSALKLIYYGGYKAKLQGYYSGFVTQGFWDTLNVKIKQINYKKLDTVNDLGLDGQDAEVIFYWNKQKRHIFKSIYEDPDSISHVLIWITDSYKHFQLQKSNDTPKFETTYQFMRPPSPPKPKLDQVTFPPPKKRK